LKKVKYNPPLRKKYFSVQLLTSSTCFRAYLDKEIPLKVSLLVWSLLRNRIPTKDNLFQMEIINNDSRLCVGGCSAVETANLLFMECNFFSAIWCFIRQWFQFDSVHPLNISNHFVQFDHSPCGSKLWRSILHVIWFLCIRVIWKKRNNRNFNNKEETIQQLLDNIKLLSFWWLKAIHVNLTLGYHNFFIFILFICFDL